MKRDLFIAIIGILILPFIITITHEIGHYLTSLIFDGQSGRIVFSAFFIGGYFISDGVASYFVDYGGGFFSGICLTIILLISWRYLNILCKSVLVPTTIMQFVYGIIEGSHVQNNYSLILIISIATFGVSTFLLIMYAILHSKAPNIKIQQGNIQRYR